MAEGELSQLQEQRVPPTCRSAPGAPFSGARSCTSDDSDSGSELGGKPHGTDNQAAQSSFRSGTSCTTEELGSFEQLHASPTEHDGDGGSREQERDEENGVTQSKENIAQLLSSLLHREGEPTIEHLQVSDSQEVTHGNLVHVLGDVRVKEVVQENTLKQQVFVSHKKRGVSPDDQLRVVTREEWLAQPPKQPYEAVEGPLNLVIINHTASQPSTTPATNMMLVRRTQLMHMEGRGWVDIGFNFLVGMDGLVYEGRGWGAVGAHNKGYNPVSVGVAFVGCFMQELPTPEALASLWLLLDEGVRRGHLTPDYRVLAHCQCRPTESPGRAFFSLIKTWPRWMETPPCLPIAASNMHGSQQIRSHSEQSASTARPMGDDVNNGSGILSMLRTPVVDDSSAQDSAVNRQSPETASEVQRITCSPTAGSHVQCTVDPTDDVGTSDSARGSCREVPFGDTQARDQTRNDWVFTEKWFQDGTAVHVSDSRNVRVGRATYIMGSLSISQVVQASSIEKQLFISKGCQEELRIVRRREWRARPPARHVTPLCRPVSRVILCHTRTIYDTEARHLLELQESAVHGRGLEDIDYNFLVGASGLVYEGRGWEIKAGLSHRCEDCSVAVAFIGKYDDRPPTLESVEAFHQLMALGEREGHLTADWRLLGHCQLVATDSPGRALYQLLKTWPHWAGMQGVDTLDLNLVPRVEWLAIPHVAPIPKLQYPLRTVVICHTGTKEPTSAEDERRQVRSLQDFEVNGRGRADLPFHFLVAPSGAVYEGRGWELAADLNLGLGLELELDVPDDSDSRCLAVALLGTFRRRPPAQPALDALDTLLALAQDRGVLARDYQLVGHCQLADTDSPGEEFLSLLKVWPRWTDRPFAGEGRGTDDSDTARSH